MQNNKKAPFNFLDINVLAPNHSFDLFLKVKYVFGDLYLTKIIS